MLKVKRPENLQALILHLSTNFINIAPDEVDEAICNALGIIGEFTNSDRSYVFQINNATNSITNTHEWCAAGIEPQIDNLKNVQLIQRPWLNKKLHNKKPFVIDDVTKLSKDAVKEKADFMDQDIKSLVVVPMVSNKKVIGLVGFDAVKKPRKWKNEEMELLKIVSDIFANALIRRSMQKKIYESEEQYRLLVENLNDGIVISQNEKIIYHNRQFAEMLGYEYEELVNADYRRIYTEEGLAILEERGRRREKGEDVPSRYETIFKKKNGEHLHVEANVRIIDYHNMPATFGIISDITERKNKERYQRKLEVELLKHQKVNSAGLLAGGIVHNIRNTLTVIIGRAQLLKQKFPDLKEPNIIISSANKILQIADAFTKKAQKEQIEKEIDFNLNDLLKTEIVYFEANQYVKNRVDIHLDINPSIPKIHGHYIDFSHAISGIIEFSVNAMEKSTQRKLQVQTDWDEKNILLKITHTGKQLPEKDMSSVFTPFHSFNIFAGKRIIGKEHLSTMQLFNAYILLERYRVKFQIETDSENQTVFTLMIPVSG